MESMPTSTLQNNRLHDSGVSTGIILNRQFSHRHLSSAATLNARNQYH